MNRVALTLATLALMGGSPALAQDDPDKGPKKKKELKLSDLTDGIGIDDVDPNVGKPGVKDDPKAAKKKSEPGKVTPVQKRGRKAFKKVISKGEEVDIRRFLRSGRATVIEFYADWLGACRKVAPQVEARVMEQTNIQLLIIDCTTQKWESPVLKQYNANSLPRLLMFEGKKLLANKTGDVLQALAERKKVQHKLGGQDMAGAEPKKARRKPLRRKTDGGRVIMLSRKGEQVSVKSQLTPGWLSLVVFMTPDHPGWKHWEENLTGAVKATPKTKLLLINVDRDQSPVALQYRVQVKSLPRFMFYDGTKLVSRDPNAAYARLKKAYEASQKKH